MAENGDGMLGSEMTRDNDLVTGSLKRGGKTFFWGWLGWWGGR